MVLVYHSLDVTPVEKFYLLLHLMAGHLLTKYLLLRTVSYLPLPL